MGIIMNDRNGRELSNRQVRRLLKDLDQLEAEAIEPLSDEEVAVIENDTQPRSISPQRDARQRRRMEELRQALLDEVQPIDSLVKRARALGLTLPALAQRLRLDPETVMILDSHLVLDVPHRVVMALAEVLQLGLPSLYSYLVPSPPTLRTMAAASRGTPAPGRPQSWEEIVRNSQMPDDDKEYWLQPE
jgi:hypothetical protein